MPTIQVRTAQHVLIDYPVAGVFDRILALIIDSLILLAYSILIFWVLAETEFMAEWVVVLFYLPIFFYHLIFEIAMNGQTPGKRALNLKVVRLDGESPTIGNYILRWILSPIDFWIFGSVAITCILLSKNGQRLGDLAAGTTVVKMERPVVRTSQEIIQALQEDHAVTFPMVIQLQATDIKLIKDALEMNRQMGNIQPVLHLTEKLRQMHGIQTDLPPVKFLYTVLKDYHHLTSRT
ncbi:MAG: RDD family protein [Cyclobacteriaceae bacterium]|jgi:uncharacterized RDD family membrane protein YckC